MTERKSTYIKRLERETAARQLDETIIDALNTRGSIRWGGNWIKANESAVMVLRHAGLRPDTPANQKLGMLIATRLMSYYDAGQINLRNSADATGRITIG